MKRLDSPAVVFAILWGSVVASLAVLRLGDLLGQTARGLM